MSNKAIFLDRDNTLIDDPGYISHPNQVRLLEGVSEALNAFRKMGYLLVVVTNQSGIARGLFTEDTLKTIHARFEELLAEESAYVDHIYYCPYHDDGVVDEYRRPSNNRKPNPGMLLQAAKELDIDLSVSWCVGNSPSDVEAGQRAGCHTILIDQMSPTGRAQPGQARPDHVAVNMREAVNMVKQFEASEKCHSAESIAASLQEPEAELDAPQAPGPDEAESAPVAVAPEPEALVVPQDPVVVEDPSPTEVPEVPRRKKKRRPRKPQPLPPEENSDSPVPGSSPQLLQAILDQLKSMQRDTMFDDFSLLRFVAGVAQIGVFVCLLISVWLLLSPARPFNSIFTTLGFAAVLQVMCLTLTIQGRK